MSHKSGVRPIEPCRVCGVPRRRTVTGATCMKCWPAERKRVVRARVIEWFWSKVDASGDCWEWTGSRNQQGYGIARPAALGRVRAHRFAYEQLVGPIPTGLQIDHLCRNRGCVNPDHLEPVTNRENSLRGFSPLAFHARKTHCPKGHPYDEVNTYVVKTPGREGARHCRACWKLRRLASKAAA